MQSDDVAFSLWDSSGGSYWSMCVFRLLLTQGLCCDHCHSDFFNLERNFRYPGWVRLYPLWTAWIVQLACARPEELKLSALSILMFGSLWDIKICRHFQNSSRTTHLIWPLHVCLCLMFLKFIKGSLPSHATPQYQAYAFEEGQGIWFCPFALLRPPLRITFSSGDPRKGRTSTCGAGSEKTVKMIRGCSTAPMKTDWELGVFSLKKKRLQGNLIAAFQYLKGAYKKGGDKCFCRACCNSTRSNGIK